MDRRSVLLSATAVALTACAAPAQPEPTPVPPPTHDAPPPPAPGTSRYDFDLGLYRQIATEPGNQFVSPFSVSAAFALLYPGARGQTAAEIARTFAFDPTPSVAAAETRGASDQLRNNNGGTEINIANAAWVERTMGLDPAYARTVSETLGGTIESVDFMRGGRAALGRINSWAARETRNRIPTILDNVDPDRRLVLTNAVYFKGRWTDTFAANATRDGDFHLAGGGTSRARLMHQITPARYVETPELQVADFDYDNGAYALAVFLPRESSSLAAFERALAAQTFEPLLNRVTVAAPQRLNVTLPKVQMNLSYDLNTPLQTLGVRDAFLPSADLSGVTQQQHLMVSGVIQKTFLAIDEDGTEAAAVTAIDVMTTAAPVNPPPPPIEFRADRPFFIALHHKQSGEVLFLGRIATTQT